MYNDIYILGVGGSTPLFVDLAEQCGYTVKGLYHYNDERTGENDHGIKILGSFPDLLSQDINGMSFMLSMGNMSIRKDISERLLLAGGRIPSMIHPSAIISRFASISDLGVLIGAGCIVQSDVNICSHVVIRDQALICHQSLIEEYCFIGPQSLVGAHTKIKTLSFIGQKSLLISGKVNTVGERSLVGAGAVVTRSVQDDVIIIGNPGKVLLKEIGGGKKS